MEKLHIFQMALKRNLLNTFYISSGVAEIFLSYIATD